jgi:phage shock protein A
MMKTLTLLLRGAVADNAQAVHDANAVAILRQQIRDAAAALATARRELAVAMAYQAAEGRALSAIQIEDAATERVLREAVPGRI